MSDEDKIELVSGDEIRLIYRGNGKFSVQSESKKNGIQLLLGARVRSAHEIADYLKALF